MRKFSVFGLVLVLSMGSRAPAQAPSGAAPSGKNPSPIVSSLIQGLGDTERGARFAAAGGLGKLEGPEVPRAIAALVPLLDDPEWCVRRQATRSLGWLGPEAPKEVLQLMEAALAEGAGGERRLLVMKVLGSLPPSAAPLLHRGLQDLERQVKLQACRSLLRVNDGELNSELRRALSELMEADHPEAPEAARLACDHGGGELALPYLERRLRMVPGHHEFLFPQGLLERVGPSLFRLLPTLLEILSAPPSSRHERALVSAILRIGESAIPALEAAHAKAGDQVSRDALSSALEALREMRRAPPPQATSIAELRDVVASLGNPAKEERVRAFEALGAHPDELPRLRDLLLRALNDPRASEFAYRLLLANPEHGPSPQALEDETAASRRFGLRALANDPSALAKLMSLVDRRSNDEDPSVRALALSLRAKSWPEAERTRSAALAALSYPDVIVREVAIDVLSRSPLPIESALIPLLEDEDLRMRRMALRLIAQRRPEATELEASLIVGATHASPELRRETATALGSLRSPGPRSLKVLEGLLQDQDRDVRIQAAFALRAFSAEVALPRLRRALDDPNWRVRLQAIETITTFGPRAAPLLPSLVPILEDPDLNLGSATAACLKQIGGACAAAVARQMAQGHYGALSHAEQIFATLGADGEPATTQLVELLSAQDVNLREIAAKSLGEIGPGASLAVSPLVRALADHRICVRSRATIALGRLGEVAVPALLAASQGEDARVRACALHALGWILGARHGVPQVPTDLRLPLVDPGPLAETGLVPDDAQLAAARRLAERLAAGPQKAMAPRSAEDRFLLRAGLRARDMETATLCARVVELADLDAWETERAIELVLPDAFDLANPKRTEFFERYLATSEVPALLDYLALSESVAQVEAWSGRLHRFSHADQIPELVRRVRNGEAWALPDEVWFSTEYTDRFREEDELSYAPAEAIEVQRSSPGALAPTLRAELAIGALFPLRTRAWLNDSRPNDDDATLLLGALRSCNGEEDEEDREVLLRALGRLGDPHSEAFLRRALITETEVPALIALSALARRGDPDALRWLHERARHDEQALGFLMEVRPELAGSILKTQLLSGGPDAPAWFLAQDSGELLFHGERWAPRTFHGIEALALQEVDDPFRLARIARSVPGCRTAAIGRKLLRLLRTGGPELVAPKVSEWIEHDRGIPSFAAFLTSVDPAGVLELFRSWSRSSSPELRDVGMRLRLRLGDPAHGGELVAWLKEDDDRDEGGFDLSRSPCPEMRRYLQERLRAAISAEEDADATALDLAVLRGLPRSAARILASRRMDPVSPQWIALAAPRPVVSLVLTLSRLPHDEATVEVAATLGSGGLTFLRRLRDEPSAAARPHLVGQLALAGDRKARADLWSAVRAGRYYWLYGGGGATTNEAQTLGWNPESFPTLLRLLESNCCLGGHVARVFNELMGNGQLPALVYGQDCHPMRVAGVWLPMVGGRWQRSVFPQWGDEGWIVTPER